MPGLELRYVGQEGLPSRLTEFDVERYFALTESDVTRSTRASGTTGAQLVAIVRRWRDC
jgi:hypothetical protein